MHTFLIDVIHTIQTKVARLHSIETYTQQCMSIRTMTRMLSMKTPHDDNDRNGGNVNLSRFHQILTYDITCDLSRIRDKNKHIYE